MDEEKTIDEEKTVDEAVEEQADEMKEFEPVAFDEVIKEIEPERKDAPILRALGDPDPADMNMIHKHLDNFLAKIAGETPIDDNVRDSTEYWLNRIADIGYVKMQDLLTAFGAGGMVGGALRQTLCTKESLEFDNTGCVDLGDLFWGYNSQYGYFYANVFDKGMCYRAQPKMISSKYKTVQASYTAATHIDKSITFNRDNNPSDGTVAGYLNITDTTYTDYTTFKAAMKGVLLAYEKAST